MITTLLILLFVFMAVPATFGLLIFYHVFIRRKTEPADQSNRINHLRLVWFAMTREEEFVDLYDWLRYDEKENMNRSNMDNAVFCNTLIEDEYEEDPRKRGFLIIGNKETLVSLFPDVKEYLMNLHPRIKEDEDEDGELFMDVDSLTESERLVVLKDAKRWFEGEGFETGEIKTLKHSEWIDEAGWKI